MSHEFIKILRNTIETRDTPDTRWRVIFFSSLTFPCNYIRPYTEQRHEGRQHPSWDPQAAQADDRYTHNLWPRHIPYFSRLHTPGCYRSGINHRKWENSGVTQLLTLTAARCSPPSLMGTHCPPCRSNNDSFTHVFPGMEIGGRRFARFRFRSPPISMPPGPG